MQFQLEDPLDNSGRYMYVKDYKMGPGTNLMVFENGFTAKINASCIYIPIYELGLLILFSCKYIMLRTHTES